MRFNKQIIIVQKVLQLFALINVTLNTTEETSWTGSATLEIWMAFDMGSWVKDNPSRQLSDILNLPDMVLPNIPQAPLRHPSYIVKMPWFYRRVHSTGWFVQEELGLYGSIFQAETCAIFCLAKSKMEPSVIIIRELSHRPWNSPWILNMLVQVLHDIDWYLVGTVEEEKCEKERLIRKRKN